MTGDPGLGGRPTVQMKRHFEGQPNEEQTMRIAIIRAGNVGVGFAGAVKAGHELMLSVVAPASVAV